MMRRSLHSAFILGAIASLGAAASACDSVVAEETNSASASGTAVGVVSSGAGGDGGSLSDIPLVPISPTPESCWAMQTDIGAEEPALEQACKERGCDWIQHVSIVSLESGSCIVREVWACFIGTYGGASNPFTIRADFEPTLFVDIEREGLTPEGWTSCWSMSDPPPECVCNEYSTQP